MNLLIIGAGGLGQAAAEIAGLSGKYDRIAFLDDSFSEEKNEFYSVLGKTSGAEKYLNEFDYAIAAFGNNKIRYDWILKLKKLGFKIPVLIHPSAIISNSAELGEGSIVREGVVVGQKVIISKGCLLNMGVLIDHKVVLKDCVHVPMGSVVRNEITLPAFFTCSPLSVLEKDEDIQEK